MVAEQAAAGGGPVVEGAEELWAALLVGLVDVAGAANAAEEATGSRGGRRRADVFGLGG